MCVLYISSKFHCDNRLSPIIIRQLNDNPEQLIRPLGTQIATLCLTQHVLPWVAPELQFSVAAADYMINFV